MSGWVEPHWRFLAVRASARQTGRHIWSLSLYISYWTEQTSCWILPEWNLLRWDIRQCAMSSQSSALLWRSPVIWQGYSAALGVCIPQFDGSDWQKCISKQSTSCIVHTFQEDWVGWCHKGCHSLLTSEGHAEDGIFGKVTRRAETALSDGGLQALLPEQAKAALMELWQWNRALVAIGLWAMHRASELVQWRKLGVLASY